MKKYLILLLIPLFFSCEKNEPKTEFESKVIGKWITKQTFINDKWLDLSTSMRMEVEFTKDKKYNWTVGGATTSGTYTVSGTTVTGKIFNQPHVYNFLSITDENAEFKVKVTETDEMHYKATKLY